MCDRCIEWGGKRWHSYGGGYYERTDKSRKPKKTVRLHREMWKALRGPIPEKHHIHHVNEDVGDNRIENLECLLNGDHQRHHRLLKPFPKCDWSKRPVVAVPCADCGVVLQRKHIWAEVRCDRCHQRRADAKRSNTQVACRHCGTQFHTRAGNFCSQRCVNLATHGAQVGVLPEGRGRAGVLR